MPLLLAARPPTRRRCRRASTRSRSTSATPATVRGSRDELASAFGNLVSNAIRYTPAGGTIALAWRVDADGSGVFAVDATPASASRAEHVPRLTERFYRVDRSRSRATGGTGLGLAIVKHVLLRHQAELDDRRASRARAARSPCACRRGASSVRRPTRRRRAAAAPTTPRAARLPVAAAPRGTGR